MPKRIIYVTGVSCAGKTILGEKIHPDLEGVWHDFDVHAERRPNTAWRQWLEWRAAECLDRITTSEIVDDLMVVTGITWPCRLVESPAWRPAMKADVEVGFLMLDPPWYVIRDRLEERLAGEPKRERRETIRFNRELRHVLRAQVKAIRRGVIAYDEDDIAVSRGMWGF